MRLAPEKKPAMFLVAWQIRNRMFDCTKFHSIVRSFRPIILAQREKRRLAAAVSGSVCTRALIHS